MGQFATDPVDLKNVDELRVYVFQLIQETLAREREAAAKIEQAATREVENVRLMSELQKVNMELLRVYEVVTLRGIIDYILKGSPGGGVALSVDTIRAKLEQMDKALSSDKKILACANRHDKVKQDNQQRDHSYHSLAVKLWNIRKRLHSTTHSDRSPKDVTDGGRAVLVRQNGLSESDVLLVKCLLSARNYPVQVELSKLVGPAITFEDAGDE